MEKGFPLKFQDRRRDLRHPIIVFKVAEEGTRPHLFGYASNISRGGLFIESINPRSPGDRYDITFQVPNTEISVNCQCEVIWARRYESRNRRPAGYGVRFADLSEASAFLIDQWIVNQN